MGVRWTLAVCLAAWTAAGAARAEESVAAAGSATGLLGARDKKAPSVGFAAMRGKKDAAALYGPYDLYEPYEPYGDAKRAMGFMGTRGKKDPFESDYEFDSRYYDKRAPSMGFAAMRGKKAPSGFMGMRGKKFDYVDVDEPAAADLWLGSARAQWPLDDGAVAYDKRAPAAGFFGMRGKKMPQGSAFFGTRGKKGPSGFVGMRGKKAPASGFMGVRGKKDSEDLESLLELLSERGDRSKRDQLTQLPSDGTLETVLQANNQ